MLPESTTPKVSPSQPLLVTVVEKMKAGAKLRVDSGLSAGDTMGLHGQIARCAKPSASSGSCREMPCEKAPSSRSELALGELCMFFHLCRKRYGF